MSLENYLKNKFLKKVNSWILNKKRELNIQMNNGEVISDWYDFSFLLWEIKVIWYNILSKRGLNRFVEYD